MDCLHDLDVTSRLSVPVNWFQRHPPSDCNTVDVPMKSRMPSYVLDNVAIGRAFGQTGALTTSPTETPVTAPAVIYLCKRIPNRDALYSGLHRNPVARGRAGYITQLYNGRVERSPTGPSMRSVRKYALHTVTCSTSGAGTARPC